MGVRGSADPAHEAVKLAVAAMDDDELSPWVADADGYVLVPVRCDRADKHDFFAL